MNVRKSVIWLVLIFCLAMPVLAHASDDLAIARWGSEKGINDRILWQFVCNDDLVVLVGEEALYTYRLDEAQLHTFPWVNCNMEEGIHVSDSDGWTEILASFTDGKEIFIVTREKGNAILSRVIVENDQVYLKTVGTLDWGPVNEYVDDDYLDQLDTCAYVDGYLYGYQGALEYAVAIPVDGGKTQIIDEIRSVFSICPYKDNRVVFVMSDSIHHKDDVCFVSWDMKTEELEEVARIPAEDFSAPVPVGVAYDWEADRFLFNYDSTVCTLDLETGEVIVLNESYTYGLLGSVLQGGYYICTDWESGTLLRSTAPNTAEIRQLKIREIPWSGLSSAVYAVQEDYTYGRTDVAVSINQERYSSAGIVEEMLTQSSDCDIYVSRLQEPSIDAAYNRGYMYAITESEKINTLFSEMRPVYADALRMDGAPVAIPLNINGGRTVLIDKDALEQAGLSIEDIPTNMLDLLNALPNLNTKLKEASVPLLWHTATVQEIRSQLVDMIFTMYESYAQYMQDNNPQAPVDTQPLRIVLEKLDSMDLSMFISTPQHIDEYTSYNTTYLLDNSSGLIEEEYNSAKEDYMLVMPMTSDAPQLMPVYLDVAFINPYSQNKDLAVEFLEQTLDYLDRANLANLLIKDIEPEHSIKYKRAKAFAEQDLAEAEAALAQAGEEADQEQLALRVEEFKKELADVETQYWDFEVEQAQWYRSHADSVIVLRYNMFSSVLDTQDASGKTLRDLYTQGQISTQDFLQIIEHKLQMMLMEGN